MPHSLLPGEAFHKFAVAYLKSVGGKAFYHLFICRLLGDIPLNYVFRYIIKNLGCEKKPEQMQLRALIVCGKLCSADDIYRLAIRGRQKSLTTIDCIVVGKRHGAESCRERKLYQLLGRMRAI